ncbi:MAG: aspartate aminotransferase family protein [Aestuariivita sp.]|nr:aspartate aminotransferase family protein [Aestuariivita sp.]MCY4346041.1 aspartate aminotransferase family protein [Aestuariivita sp.]
MSHISNHLPTAELQALDAAHHLHPFTAERRLAEKGVRVITRAQGVWLTDSDGQKIIDGMAGLWCVNIGYGREELADIAARQMRELPFYNTFFQTTHLPAISLAEKVCEKTPQNLNHVFFVGSGSEAIDTSIRMVRTYWAIRGYSEKKAIISRKNAYHGSTVGAASLGGMTSMHEQGDLPIPNVHHINQPDWWSEGGDLSPAEFGWARAQELERTINELGEDRIAAFVAEPIQGAGGAIIPPETYWPEIQRICDAYEILLIADEVICGFGRTGNWFGSETFKIKPDVMTIAKGLSSGYQPIGGCVISDDIAEVLGQQEFYHGYTYSGHPVAAAVALENIRLLEEENIIGRAANVVAPYLKEKWEELEAHPMVGEARIIGLIASIALTPDKETRAKFAAATGTSGEIVRDRCFANNLVMRHVGDRMVISPSLIITPEEIDIVMSRAWQSLDEAEKIIKTRGLWKVAPPVC